VVGGEADYGYCVTTSHPGSLRIADDQRPLGELGFPVKCMSVRDANKQTDHPPAWLSLETPVDIDVRNFQGPVSVSVSEPLLLALVDDEANTCAFELPRHGRISLATYGAPNCHLSFDFDEGQFAVVFSVASDRPEIHPMICRMSVAGALKTAFGYVGGGHTLRLPFFVDDFEPLGANIAQRTRIGVFCYTINGDVIPDGWLPRYAFFGSSQWIVALFGPIIRFFTLHPDVFSQSAAQFLMRFMADPVVEGVPSIIEFVKGKVRLHGSTFHTALQDMQSVSDLCNVLSFLLDALIANPRRDDLDAADPEAGGRAGTAPEMKGELLKSLPSRDLVVWASTGSKQKAVTLPWALVSRKKLDQPGIDLLLGIVQADRLRVLPPPMVDAAECFQLVYVKIAGD
jgi:hypothetical protein